MKKITTRLVSFLTALMLLCASLPGVMAYSESVITYPVEGGNLYFDTSTGEIISCDGTVTKAVVPDQISGVTVTAITGLAFAFQENLTEVWIPAGLTNIEVGAFTGCSALAAIFVADGNLCYSSDERGVLFDKEKTKLLLAPGGISGEYDIPEGVTEIEEYAFSGCGRLSKVTVSSSVEKLRGSVFMDCVSLTEVTILGSVLEIPEYSFYRCVSLSSVKLPNSLTSLGYNAFAYCEELTDIDIPNRVTIIDDYAFCGCTSLEEIQLPEGVTQIGEGAFFDCDSLSSVTIPAGVTFIGGNAFGNCDSLTGIHVDEGNLSYSSDERGVLFDKEKTKLLLAPGGISGEYAIPEGVTEIEEYAFSGCGKLTGVTVSSGVEKLGLGVFINCTDLMEATIIGSVPEIPDETFSGCTSLRSVKLPDSVTRFGISAFWLCESLCTIDIPNSVTIIDEYAFYECSSLDIQLPEGVTQIGMFAFDDCDSLSSVTIPAGVTFIGGNAFSNCDSLTGIYVDSDNPSYSCDVRGVLFDKEKTRLLQAPGAIRGEYAIPEGTKKVESGAFSGCDLLTGLRIPASVTALGDAEAYNCVNLEYFSVDSSNQSYSSDERGVLFDKEKEYLYRVPRAISGEYAIPEGTSYLSNCAFDGCGELTKLSIPGSVTDISFLPFEECDSLSAFSVAEENEYYCSDDRGVLFNKDKTLLVKAPAMLAGEYDIPLGVTEIEMDSFENCKQLTSVTFSGKLSYLPSYVFENCISLTSITLPGSIKEIDFGAFYNCVSLESAYFLGNAPEYDTAFLYEDASTGERFPLPKLTIYYMEGAEGWTSPTWNGYPAVCLPFETHEHSYDSYTVTEPSCTEQGYTTYYCFCGYQHRADYVDALGHSYVNLICTVCGKAFPVEYTDVPENAWYYEAVMYALEHGLMNGMGDNKFEPETEMSRAMLVTVLWRYEGQPEEGGNSFTDVSKDAWYTQAVAWAAENGIVTGVGNGKFDPEGIITREQLATILYRYSVSLDVDTSMRANLGGFPDSGKVSAYAEDALSWAVAKGLVTGTKIGNSVYLDPQGSATRAQVATILMRFIENVVE